MDREAVMTALCSKLFAVADFRTTGRKVLLWTKVSAFPAIFVRNLGDLYEHPNIILQRVTMRAEVWIYAHGNPEDATGSQLNDLVDAVEGAFAPDNQALHTMTLGGLVQHCWIDGESTFDPGDIDNFGKAILPVKILVP